MLLWDLSHSLRVSGEETYDLVLLNTPIPEEHAAIFQLLWNHARYRIAADGGANRLFQFMQTHEEELKLPSLICGDLDSIKSHVRASFEAKVCIYIVFTLGCGRPAISVSILDRPAKGHPGTGRA